MIANGSVVGLDAITIFALGAIVALAYAGLWAVKQVIKMVK